MALWTLADTATEYWLDADNAGSITLAGSDVSAWNDLSGNSRHATQGTVANRPIYASNVLNGKPVVRFEPGDTLAFQSNFSTFGKSYFILWRRTAGTNAAILLQSAAVDYSYLHYGNSWFDGNMAQAVPITNGIWYGNLSVAGARFSNGTAFGGGQDATSIFDRIGWQSSVATIEVAELAVFSTAISQNLREQVEGYSLWKWGLQASLPENHPYKNAAPTAGGNAGAVHFFTFGI